jgi:Raf kinase inhibitor-like YbhB/YbcL family protein
MNGRSALRVCAAAGLMLPLTACVAEKPGPRPQGGNDMNLTLTSTAFAHGDAIPAKHTGTGPDVSPALAWTNVPDGTTCFALICDDPDAPLGIWVHWVLYDIPAHVRELREGLPKSEIVLESAKHGRNDFGKIGYGGPMPPPGKLHHYFFRLYALDGPTDLRPGATRAQVLKVTKSHVLAEAELMGTFQR